MTTQQLKLWRSRPYSWSQHSAWDYNQHEWYTRYILGERTPGGPALDFGSKFAASVEFGTPMAPVTIYPVVEYGINTFLDDLELVGYMDSWHPEELKLAEYKTGVKKWDQKRVDEHGQMTYYAMLHFLQDQIKPEDIHMILQWLPMETKPDFSFGLKGEIHTFETSRTMRDVLKLMSDIQQRRKDMEAYITNKQPT